MEADQIREIMAEENYANEILSSIEKLQSKLEASEGVAAFIDIDSVPVDNRCIRQLTLKHPSVYFFCMSRDKFHPKLKEAICYHIYACMRKPIDPDELIYWLHCIDSSKNESRSRPSVDATTRRDKST